MLAEVKTAASVQGSRAYAIVWLVDSNSPVEAALVAPRCYQALSY